MFDLDQAVAEWRRQLVASGIKAPEVLDELESHLREEIEGRMGSGLSAPDAFNAAVHQMGQAKSIQAEFAKTANWATLPLPSWVRAGLLGLGMLSGVCYVGLVAYGLLKHEMSGLHRWLGFSALAVSLVLAVGSYYLCRRSLSTAQPSMKNLVGLGGGTAMIAWLFCFFLVILPRCELEIAGLVVALVWVFVPGAVLLGAGLAFEKRDPRQPAVR